MDTIWLEDFLAVLNEGSFSRAAERRAVSQPAFSRRIKTLEIWIGTPLFDRTTHSVKLTKAGEHFRPAAEDMLRQLNQARYDALIAAQLQSETLKLAATHVLSLTFFPVWLRKLEAQAPSPVTVQLTADHMAACEKVMLEGRAQFLLCHDHPAAATKLASNAFRSVEVGQDVLVPVTQPALLQAYGESNLPYLAYTSESGMGRILAASWAKTGRKPPADPSFSSHLASVLAAMARDGRGMAWSPLSLVTDDIEGGRLVRLRQGADDVPMAIRLFRPRARQSPAAEALWNRALKLSKVA
ncbi:LysR family transcriptional regulator [Acidocella aminolytica]|uniref:Transcriptional regulator LysR n=1 Tax=Acidocella aminolytica 101 = DSM 11237 TaxID=1120923 RepID=A0A0D6PCY2_9PROT|nr:LysR family transcriptional regulator [Acidocella aminolytica]GAN79537.1 transcriptional regulator LysR [Acidocella aminolytica 101 = DSM 11237]SHF34222.1 transcriptional regulator, LysR family [Acidocella aminolytica 101 = DSM 11237]